MWQFLVHAKTYARIEAALKEYKQKLSPIVMDDEGDLKHPWGKSEAEPAIVYGTQDAYFSPAVVTFFQTTFGFAKLDWFQSSAAGTEHPMIQAVGKQAAQFSGSHAQSDAIAEWVLWAGLDFFQAGRERRAAQNARRWQRLSFREISDTHWVIYGFGAIGQATGQHLMSLGAEVTGVRRSGGSSPAASRLVTPSDAGPALARADAVLLCLPHDPQTENLADQAFFDRLKPGALFVNVGRGALVDETALLAALGSGQLAHAALDVVRTEPLPNDHPIWGHPKITLTPHISALTEQAMIRTDRIFLQNLSAFLNDQPLVNAVPAHVFA